MSENIAKEDITEVNDAGQTVVVVPKGQPIPEGVEVPKAKSAPQSKARKAAEDKSA